MSNNENNIFTITAILKRIDSFVSKSGKTILTLVLETGGQYPNPVPIKCFGRLADEAGEWQPGDTLTVKGKLGGREWQGRVFGDNVADSVEVTAKGAGTSEAPPPAEADDNIPF